MPSCAAIKCTNRSNGRGHQLFRFPLGDGKRLRQWVTNVRRANWTPNENSRLCACHFEEDCFILRGGRKSLSSIAVPTIFNPYLSMRSTTTQTNVSCLPRLGFTDSFDHTYSKHHTDEKSEDFSTADVLETKSDCSRVLCDGTDHDYAAKEPELRSEKELVVDLEITVDEELAVIQEVTIKEDFKVEEEEEEEEEEVSGYEEITTVEEVKPHTAITDASAAVISAATADHDYIVNESPRTLRRQLLSVEEKLQNCRKKLREEKENTKRLLKTVQSLTKVICVLNQRNSMKT